MAIGEVESKPYLLQLRKLQEDASYSAQAYFEGAKQAEFWGRAIVFVPALLGAAASVVLAFGAAREFGAVGAVAGAVAATAAFLGADKKAASFKDSARAFTKIRHRAALELDLAARASSEGHLDGIVRGLRKEYEEVVSVTEPVPGRAFKKAQKRIGGGVLNYDDGELATEQLSSP